MEKLVPADLMSLEQYARERPVFRARVLEHKRERQLAVGPNATWCFEDRLTVQYQVQEMLRTERIFEPAGILDELGAYNPLIPDGNNWKVTLLIEFADPLERARELARLRGIEDRCWVEVAGYGKVFAVADEEAAGTHGAEWMAENRYDAIKADYVLSETKVVDLHDPTLTLKGLRLYFERNAPCPKTA